jgi:hypothetical protein
LPDELLAVLLCQEFGWDYETYLNQPVWFIRLIFAKMSIDSEILKKQQNGNSTI